MRFIDELFGDDLHAKRVLSLSNGVVGVLHAALMSVHAIGQAYAKVAHIKPKSGIKQVDRTLSNQGVDLRVLFPDWVRFVVGAREDVVVALDWTEFDDDDHSTLCAYLAHAAMTASTPDRVLAVLGPPGDVEVERCRLCDAR